MDKMEKESVNRLERWFDLNKKSIENFTGKEQQILQINIDLKQQSEAHDFYSLVITNMKDFGQMTFDNPRKFNRCNFSLLDLLSKLTKFSFSAENRDHIF